MSERKFPRPEEVQKEFENFVKHRFGNSVHVFTSQMNQQADNDDEPTPESPEGFHLEFDYKPKDIKSYLDRYVIRQDEAKIALAIAVCDHYNHAKTALKLDADQQLELEYAKQNVLLLGPTGVGKTYLIRKIADLIGVPFVKADATRFSETGYVGANVDDLIRDLVAQADGDLEKAQYGIVYLDEADKLASPPQQQGRDVNGRGVQFGLLRLMEETDVDLRSGNDIQSQIQALMDMQKGGGSSKVNTRNILFIVSGAFGGLEPIIRKRLNQQPIGFNRTETASLTSDTDVFRYVTTQDFIEFGFEPEFIGRLPVRVSCDNLSADDLFQILQNSAGSIIHQYVSAFAAYGIKVDFTEAALRAIAERAHHEKTGARSLMTICEAMMRPFKYELPSSPVKEFTVTADTVANPLADLEQLLAQPNPEHQRHLHEALDRFEQDFHREHDLTLILSDDLKEKIIIHCMTEALDAYDFCRQLFQTYEHGLKLAQQQSGQAEFHLPAAAFEQPQKQLEQIIMESYDHAENPPQQPST